MNFAVPADYWVKLKEIEKRDKYLDLARGLKRTIEHESDDDNSCNWCARYTHQRIGTGTGGLENKWTRRDHPNYRIIKIGQNTEKSPGDLRSYLMTICTCRKTAAVQFNNQLRVHTFSRAINPKVKVIVLLEFDLASYNVTTLR